MTHRGTRASREATELIAREKSYHGAVKTAILLLSLCLPVLADLATGERALKGGDYAVALKNLVPLAKRGNADAETDLGDMYFYGQGVEQDYVEALRWFRLAADQGNARAQDSLGGMYYNGQGSLQNYAEAIRWYRLAAKQRDALAQVLLGGMYEYGHGVQQDYSEATRWYRLAADQGYVEGQYFLGYMYHEGHGVPQDYKEAARWLRLASEQQNAVAQVSLGGMYENGQGVPQDYTQAYMWFNLAAASNIPENAKEGINGRDRVAGRLTADQIAEAQSLGRKEAVSAPGTFDLHVTNVRSLEPDKRIGFSKALEVYAVSAYGPQMSYVLYCTKVAPQAGQVYAAVDDYLDSSWLRLWPVERSTLPSGPKKRGRVFRVIIIHNMLPGPKPDAACDIYSETARQ